MAELTQIETKIGEVIGLAQAAQGATEKVSKLVEDGGLKQTLEQMHREAVETEERTTQVAENLDGKKTAILEKARETKQEATEMMSTYLGSDADGLDGLEFMTMAEAGEVGHWQILDTMNQKARNPALQQVIDWATPIQERHLDEALRGSLKLAADEDPNEPAEGFLARTTRRVSRERGAPSKSPKQSISEKPISASSFASSVAV